MGQIRISDAVASPIYYEDFSSYANTAALLAAVTADPYWEIRTDGNASNALDLTTGYGSSDRSFKGTINALPPGTGQPEIFSGFVVYIPGINLSNGGLTLAQYRYKQIWIEMAVKYSANWKTDWGRTDKNSDQKTLLTSAYGSRNGDMCYRNETKIGQDTHPGQFVSFSFLVNDADGQYAETPRFWADPTLTGADFWDNDWHSLKVYLAFNPVANTISQKVWADGSLRDNNTVANNTSPMTPEYFHGVQFGANINEPPTEEMNWWIGRMAIYADNPGW